MNIDKIFDGAENTVKKGMKSKPFMVALCVVAVLAIFAAWQKSKTTYVSDNESDYGYASGYSGYPYIGGNGEQTEEGYYNFDNEFNSLLTQLDMMQTEMQEQLNQQESIFAQKFDQQESIYSQMFDQQESVFSSQLDKANDQIAVMQETQELQAAEIERQNILSIMQTNSTLWSKTNDQTLRDNLHRENMMLADSIGLNFNEGNGTYTDSNGRLAYLPATTTVTFSANPANVISGKVSFDPNTDYMSEIVKAAGNGSTGATLNALAEKRKAKMSALGITNPKTGYDPNIDYQQLINNAKAVGANDDVISALNEAREAKIAGQKK